MQRNQFSCLNMIFQVTCEYKYEKGACIPLRVHTVVISIQHDETVTMEQLRKDLMEKVVRVVIPKKYIDDKTVYHLQPSGKFIIGGPQVGMYTINGRQGNKEYLIIIFVSSS